MRRGVTVLVVVVVAAIALAAGIDALRDGSDSEPAAQTEAEPPTVPTPADVEAPALAAADEVRDWLGRVGGTGCLFVTLPGCIIRALRVPSLEFEEEPNVRAPCNFSLDASGGVLASDVSAAPIGELTAVCEDGGLNVFQDGGFRTRLTNACAPAWMGDGTLTFLRNGGLWHGIEDARQLVSREQVGELVGRPSALAEIAWVDDERFWAVVRSAESSVVALLTTDRLVSSPSFTTTTIDGLRVSASGMVAARTDQGSSSSTPAGSARSRSRTGRRSLGRPASSSPRWRLRTRCCSWRRSPGRSSRSRSRSETSSGRCRDLG